MTLGATKAKRPAGNRAQARHAEDGGCVFAVEVFGMIGATTSLQVTATGGKVR